VQVKRLFPLKVAETGQMIRFNFSSGAIHQIAASADGRK
jgi:hypothetical protein